MCNMLKYKGVFGFSAGVAMVISLFFIGGMATANAGKIGKRQGMQQDRIRNGIATNKLTRVEVMRLQKEQLKIRAMKKAAWSDGKLNKKERARINRAQNKASKKIYAAKHNKRKRK